MTSKSTTRVQMELHVASMERLKKLKEKTEASSYAEVTKNAYRLYAHMIELHEQGNTFWVQTPNGEKRRIEFFY